MKKITKPKPIKLSKLKKQAWKIWSLIGRSVGCCELCGIKYKEINTRGKPTILNCHHVIGRENYTLSWDVLNSVSLCCFCHKYSPVGPHRGGIIFSDWFMKKYPEKYKYLLENYSNKIELTIEHMQKIIETLNITLNNLNEDKTNGK